MDIQERFRGSLLGLAAGDALGTTLEFKARGSFEAISDMVGGGPFGLKPGQWTDDTSMALCLAQSLFLRDSFDPVDQMKRYVLWFRQGHLSSTGTCFDIGNTVARALLRFEDSGEPYCGSTDPKTAGNGSLMRLAPVPLFAAAQPERAIALAGDSSRTTHGATAAVDACRYFAGLILGALRGVAKNELLAPHFAPAPFKWQPGDLCPEIDAVAAGSFRAKNEVDIRASGYVVHTLEAALWAFYNSDSFSEGCLKVVNLGEDADTSGAVYGQLAGAYYGTEGIPERWLNKLSLRSSIEDLADGLYYSATEVEWQ